jgi:hypothetical protein
MRKKDANSYQATNLRIEKLNLTVAEYAGAKKERAEDK